MAPGWLALARACPMSSADAVALEGRQWLGPYQSDADGLAGVLKKRNFRSLISLSHIYLLMVLHVCRWWGHCTL